MHRWTGLACTAIFLALAATMASAQTPTPAPAAEPLIPDWIWMAAIAIALVAAIWYFLRTRRG
jgi:hypothetical protein